MSRRWMDTGCARRWPVTAVAWCSSRSARPTRACSTGDWVQDAAARGLTLIAYDRPGYGGSSRRPGRTVADCAADVRRLSEVVGFERCVVWGFSGGGPHALACGALLDDLVAAVATIGSPAPFDAPGLDFSAGWPDEAQEDHELFLSDRAAWERQGEQQREELLAMSAGELAEEWSTGKSPVDCTALQGEFGVWLHRAAQAAVAGSVDGWTDDDIAWSHSPWGFDPASISIPVKLWHGLEDGFVPFAHGRWLAETDSGRAGRAARSRWTLHGGRAADRRSPRVAGAVPLSRTAPGAVAPRVARRAGGRGSLRNPQRFSATSITSTSPAAGRARPAGRGVGCPRRPRRSAFSGHVAGARGGLTARAPGVALPLHRWLLP